MSNVKVGANPTRRKQKGFIVKLNCYKLFRSLTCISSEIEDEGNISKSYLKVNSYYKF